jgi:hypothetical protein
VVIAMKQQFRLKQSLVVTIGEQLVAEFKSAGVKSVLDATERGVLVTADGKIRPEIDMFGSYVIVIPHGGEELRDSIAMTLGDERCKWAYAPYDPGQPIENTLIEARPMWTDEVASMDDIPEPGPVETFKTGFGPLDDHGWRITTPAFMPVIGPYGSGKSVLLRQLLVNLWRLHKWPFLLTSFEEKIKPRYERDLRRHFIGKPMDRWYEEDVARADAEIRQAARFLMRKRGASLDMNRLLDRIEFSCRVYGTKVVAIDPVNEIDHQVGRGESKTDYMGRFIMALKQLADDYNLLMIVCAHPPKDGVEKRLQRNGVLTLNDGADTAHWGNKADIGLAVWRNLDGPTMVHIDKLKDHETMGKPTLCEMFLDPALNKFRVGRIGYEILASEAPQ